MGTVTKFQFDTDFDDQSTMEAADACVDEAPPEPVFAAADVEAARAEGYAAGRDAGLSEARSEIENAIAKALAAIGEQLAALRTAHTDAWAACERRALALAAAITRKIVPDLARESALDTIAQRIADALPHLIEEPRVVIRVPDDILDALQDRIATITESSGFSGQCILLSERELSGPDCRIEWADGGIDFDARRLWQEIDSAVDGYLNCGPQRPPPDAAADPTPTDEPPANRNAQETSHG